MGSEEDCFLFSKWEKELSAHYGNTIYRIPAEYGLDAGARTTYYTTITDEQGDPHLLKSLSSKATGICRMLKLAIH